MDYIRDVFFSMEEEKSLFSLQVGNGVYIWNCCRLDVYQYLLQKHGVGFASQTHATSNFAINLICKIKNFLSSRYVLLRKPKCIFITAQRTRAGRALFDNITDHLIDEITSTVVAIELSNRCSVSYLRMLLGLNTRIPPIDFVKKSDQLDLILASARISQAIAEYFGFTLDVSILIENSFFQYQANYKYFSSLFTKHCPQLVIGVNDDTLYGLYAATKKFQIPTIELQHGSSNLHTILWSFPKSIESNHVGLSLPDAYFTFSEFWTNNTNYPVRIIQSIGNDNNYQDFIAFESKAVLVISAYMYYDELVGLSNKLSNAMDIKIYYKLHPNEYCRKKEAVSTFKNYANVEVLSDELEFKDLYSLCSHVVLVHSSTAYQALQAGKSVCIYKYSNYSWHSDIFDYVDLFDTSSELVKLINAYSTANSRAKDPKCLPLFYAPFDPCLFKMAVNKLMASRKALQEHISS